MSINDTVFRNLQEFITIYVPEIPDEVIKHGGRKFSKLQELANRIVLECKICFKPKGIDRKIKEEREKADVWVFQTLNELQLSLFDPWVSGELSDKEFTASMIGFIGRKREDNFKEDKVFIIK